MGAPDRHPPTYLPIPEDSPQVTIKDHRQHIEWPGWVSEQIVHDSNGFIDPFDINWRYTIHRDGEDVSDEFALPDPPQEGETA